MNPTPKLFIPGPTEVHPEVLAELARPAISHRGEECARLWKVCREGLARLMGSSGEILLYTGSASALMEAAIRNLVPQRSLHLVCGAFSKRWYEIAQLCGRDAARLEVPMGQGFTPAMLHRALVEGGPFDAVTVVHNETSTGVANPVAEFAAVMREFPGTLLLVDTVSSLAGMPVKVDEWGLDVCLAGVQKCLALPPGLAVASVSARAMERAATVADRGWCLDFVRLQKGNLKEQSPSTPSTPHLYALARQLERIAEEGLVQRWARHRAMAERVRSWAAGHGWEMFPAEGFRSDTVSCIARGAGPDFVPVLATLKEQGYLVSSGYGDLKGRTFRIGHLGEHDLASIDDLLARFDAALQAAGTRA
ncbi:MAG TPA: alanine--glyoxylate aminotransferase family protein [Planctomycetota bacterium]